MLKSLNIENIAVIEQADIEFSSGLNVLTGETGAGKSIVVDSINAVLGERTTRELVRNGADHACVTAVFENVNDAVVSKLNEFGIDCEDDVILKRRINASGKSNCWINSAPCTVAVLHTVGAMLVNIHGQHDSQALLNPDYHYSFLDMYCGNQEILGNYIKSFKELLSVRKKLKALTVDADTKDRQLELLEYQINELSQAGIEPGERECLKNRKNVILNAQGIVDFINTTLESFNGDEYSDGFTVLLDSLCAQSDKFKSIDSKMSDISSVIYRLRDDAEELKDLLNAALQSVDYDEDELMRIDDRLDMYYHFSNKYGETEEDMLEYLNNAEKKRDAITNSDAEMERLNTAYDLAYEKTISAANDLTASRKEAASRLETEIKEQLEFLDMPKIVFSIDFAQGKLSATGSDRIEFLISTNPGEPPKPLSKIASGGELSRIMLAIKNIIAGHDTVGTLIFDEIDTGVSGRASRKIGLKLKAVSDVCQVICVTHSAQIASVADTHLLVEKKFCGDRTYTGVSRLDYEQRKYELARIMGGIDITQSMLNSAEELLNNE